MKIVNYAFGMLLTMVFASSNAQDAPPAPPPGQVTFESIDADADGSITLDEVKTNFKPRMPEGRTPPEPEVVFARWDADGDGKVTAEEFANRPRGQGQRGQQGQGGQGGQQGQQPPN